RLRGHPKQREELSQGADDGRARITPRSVGVRPDPPAVSAECCAAIEDRARREGQPHRDPDRRHRAADQPVWLRTTPPAAVKERYSSQPSIATTTARTLNAAEPGTICSSRSSIDNPKPTTHASKLIHIRRKVSGDRCRIRTTPIGTPTTTLGTIFGISATL